MLRYFEALGRVRRAMSVVKKRTGSHEDTIREFRITSRGIELGPALHEFQGVLRGVPTYVGGGAPLMRESVMSKVASFPSERVLILAPRGRDAVVAKEILRDAKLHATICLDIGELMQELGSGADVAVVTEESMRGRHPPHGVVGPLPAAVVGFSFHAADRTWWRH